MWRYDQRDMTNVLTKRQQAAGEKKTTEKPTGPPMSLRPPAIFSLSTAAQADVSFPYSCCYDTAP